MHKQNLHFVIFVGMEKAPRAALHCRLITIYANTCNEQLIYMYT